MSLLVLAVISECLAFSKSHAGEPAGNNIDFRFACGAVVGPEQGRRFVPITGDTALNTGDRLKFMLELHKTCFVYLILESTQGEMNMLFPYQLSRPGSYNELKKIYYVPRDDSWFELDEKGGTETFYLIASASRLNTLEDLFQKTGADGSTQGELIRAEIKALKKGQRTLTASAERPVPIGGNVRAVGTDISTDMGAAAIEISAKDFYCRTFAIEHK